MKKTIILLALLFFVSAKIFAHEKGAPFSGAIIDPLRVHHGHIENEQRLNSFYFNGFGSNSGFSNSYEIAFRWNKKFNFGSEMLIPFSNSGINNEYGIGDIELWPIKYAFINDPQTIFTGVLNLNIPTGNTFKGLGEGNTTLGGLLFLDHAYRNWFFGLNTEMVTNVAGTSQTKMELSSVMSYSFIKGTGTDMAASEPDQKIVPALSMELISESVLGGSGAGNNLVTIIPGLNIELPKSRFQFRIGAEIPLSVERTSDYTFIFQIGNHLNWGKMFNKKNVHHD